MIEAVNNKSLKKLLIMNMCFLQFIDIGDERLKIAIASERPPIVPPSDASSIDIPILAPPLLRYIVFQ